MWDRRLTFNKIKFVCPKTCQIIGLVLSSRFDLTRLYLGGFLLINLKLNIWNGIDVCMVEEIDS